MIHETIGTIIICIGVLFVAIGVFGLFRFNNFFDRILIGSKIDTVGFITICAGAIVRSGLTWFSLKVLLLTAVVMIINPVITHEIARSAYHGGFRLKEEDTDASGD